jgi:hypothetical protein
MAELNKQPPREPLLQMLWEANKRAATVLGSTREVGNKLFGSRPEETTASMPEMSATGLAARLLSTLSELEDELGRQHTSLGEANVAAQQGRAVSSY